MNRGQPLCDLQLLRNTVNQRLRFFPAKARVCNGFAEYAFTDLLTAVFQIALNHETFDKLFDVFGSFEDAQRFLELGASRLGTSRLVKIMEAEKPIL